MDKNYFSYGPYDSTLFSDFEPLTISEREYKILHNLRELSLVHNVEYGQAYNGDDYISEVFTSDEEAMVVIPPSVYEHGTVRLYHSHTNDTVLSMQDLELMLNSLVERMSVITVNGFIFSVTVGNGYLPSFEEFQEAKMDIVDDVYLYLIREDDFYGWSTEKKLHEAVKEEAFRIARNFKWRLEGGTL